MKRIIMFVICFMFACIGALIKDLTSLETLGYVFIFFGGLGLFWLFAVSFGRLEDDL